MIKIGDKFRHTEQYIKLYNEKYKTDKEIGAVRVTRIVDDYVYYKSSKNSYIGMMEWFCDGSMWEKIND